MSIHSWDEYRMSKPKTPPSSGGFSLSVWIVIYTLFFQYKQGIGNYGKFLILVTKVLFLRRIG
jgi:antibiotic biosynthesis monooxygenase (ABM) superfamily enzyme